MEEGEGSFARLLLPSPAATPAPKLRITPSARRHHAGGRPRTIHLTADRSARATGFHESDHAGARSRRDRRGHEAVMGARRRVIPTGGSASVAESAGFAWLRKDADHQGRVPSLCTRSTEPESGARVEEEEQRARPLRKVRQRALGTKLGHRHT